MAVCQSKNIACADAIAGKPAPTGFVSVHKVFAEPEDLGFHSVEPHSIVLARISRLSGGEHDLPFNVS
jgi:hypothetical protein